MDIYLLTATPSPGRNMFPGGEGRTRVVGVRLGDFYEARQRAFAWAEESGDRTVCVVCDGVHLFRRPASDNRLFPAHVNDYHGLWLYLHRLARAFGHVYVPPSSAARQIPQSGVITQPTIPLVSVYQVKALQQVRSSWATTDLGAALCAAGYHSYTVGDYFYQRAGLRDDEMLDDSGTASSWTKSYVAAVNTLLE